MNNIRNLRKEELNAMSPSDFRNAMEATDVYGKAAREKYIIWAKLICAKKIESETPNRDSIIEDVAYRSVTELYYNLRSFDASKGMSFKSYFTTRILWCLYDCLEEYGLYNPNEKKKLVCDEPDYLINDIEDSIEEEHDDDAVDDDESKVDTYEHYSDRRVWTVSDISHEDDDDDIFSSRKWKKEAVVREDSQVGRFSYSMIPYIQEYMNKLPYVKKRILMAGWGFSISPEEYHYSKEDVKKHGYATLLSNELAKEGIKKTPGAIKTMLRDILNHLAEYLVKQTGLSREDFHDELTGFMTTDTSDDTRLNPVKEKVRSLLLDLDTNDLSDDEAAMLFLQFFR